MIHPCKIDASGWCAECRHFHFGEARALALDHGEAGQKARATWHRVRAMRDGRADEKPKAVRAAPVPLLTPYKDRDPKKACVHLGRRVRNKNGVVKQVEG